MKLHLHVDITYLTNNQLIIIGWLLDLDNVVTNAVVQAGKVKCDLPKEEFARFERKDVSEHLGIKDHHEHGIILTVKDTETLKEDQALKISLFADSKKVFSLKYVLDAKEKSIDFIQDNWPTWGSNVEKALRGNTDALKGLFEILPSEGEILHVAVDCLAWIPATGYFISGWLMPRENLQDLILSSSDDHKSFLQETFWYNRQDVIDNSGLAFARNLKIGFICLVPLKKSQSEKDLNLVLVSGKNRRKIACETKDWLSNPLAATQELFSLFSPISQNLQTLLNDHIGPAAQALWSHRNRLEIDPNILSFGEVPDNPKTSILIPLYGRYDFVEYQLSQFVNDPYMKYCEIIYINDDPKIQEPLLQFCSLIQPIYQMGFKLAHAGQNLGYAGANNWGAKLAKGELLLLLNSDVMPKTTGWLEKLERAYEEENMGALGCKLLYEDESIQHAGMTFVRLPLLDNMWMNEHLGKGLANVESAKGLKEMTTITAACLLISKETYMGVGGLSEDYILGDFEDSDLCLKLIEKGYKNYYLPDVELYHLERQSQSKFSDENWKSKLTIYNCWQHTKKWNDVIENLQGQSGE